MRSGAAIKEKSGTSWRPWLLLGLLLLTLILAPFFLFEDSMNRLVERLMNPAVRSGAIAAAVVLLLAADVLLPVPSSIVSTAAGALLGFLPGLAASTIGMALGSLLGYAFGRKFGLPLVRRTVREGDLEQVSERFRNGAVWALAVMRPIPVLAEASTLFAGVTRVPLPLYLVVTTLANAGISAVYCAAGANALSAGSFLLAFAASIGLPAAALAINKLVRRTKT